MFDETDCDLGGGNFGSSIVVLCGIIVGSLDTTVAWVVSKVGSLEDVTDIVSAVVGGESKSKDSKFPVDDSGGRAKSNCSSLVAISDSAVGVTGKVSYGGLDDSVVLCIG